MKTSNPIDAILSRELGEYIYRETIQHTLDGGIASLLFKEANQEFVVLVYANIINIISTTNSDRYYLRIHGVTPKTALCYMLYAFDILISRAGTGTCVMNLASSP